MVLKIKIFRIHNFFPHLIIRKYTTDPMQNIFMDKNILFFILYKRHVLTDISAVNII